jgi:hypothetical protein
MHPCTVTLLSGRSAALVARPAQVKRTAVATCTTTQRHGSDAAHVLHHGRVIVRMHATLDCRTKPNTFEAVSKAFVCSQLHAS